MLLNQEQVSSIKSNKVTLVKNFVSLETNYDFNFMSDLLEENQLEVHHKSAIGNLRDIFSIRYVDQVSKEFRIFFDFFSKMFKYNIDSRDGVDMLLSFVSQAGLTHADKEDVFIIGLNGSAIYKTFEKENKYYEINKGDLIFIPKGLKHKVIAMTPRTVISAGFHGKRQ